MATTSFKVKVNRLSSQKNQNGSYYYQIVDKGSLPKDAQLFGRDGRIGFYSSTLKGSQNTEFSAEVLCIPVTNSTTGEVVNRVVFARSEDEKKQSEALERKSQIVRKAARAFGISASKAGEMAFERMLDNLLTDETADAE